MLFGKNKSILLFTTILVCLFFMTPLTKAYANSYPEVLGLDWPFAQYKNADQTNKIVYGRGYDKNLNRVNLEPNEGNSGCLPPNNDSTKFMGKLCSCDNDYSVGYYSEQWKNKQDTCLYYKPYNGLHHGEDWNYLSGDADVGKKIYPIAAGKVVERNEEGGGSVTLKHTLPTNNNIYSIYTHIVPSVKEGDILTKEQQVGTIKHIKHPHLDLIITEGDHKKLYTKTGGKYASPYTRDIQYVAKKEKQNGNNKIVLWEPKSVKKLH